VKIEFNPDMNTQNIALRGISFEQAAEFEWETAVIIGDARRDYKEPRFRAMGMIGKRHHAMVFTPRPDGIRVIILRKANRREERKYAETSES